MNWIIKWNVWIANEYALHGMHYITGSGTS